MLKLFSGAGKFALDYGGPAGAGIYTFSGSAAADNTGAHAIWAQDSLDCGRAVPSWKIKCA